jgi:hypothetical protein
MDLRLPGWLQPKQFEEDIYWPNGDGGIYNSLIEQANQEQKRDECNMTSEQINELLIARKNANRIYYAGTTVGVITGLAGLLFGNILYIFVGFGIFLTSITGILEAKRNVC